MSLWYLPLPLGEGLGVVVVSPSPAGRGPGGGEYFNQHLLETGSSQDFERNENNANEFDDVYIGSTGNFMEFLSR